MTKQERDKQYKKLASKYAKNIEQYLLLATEAEQINGKQWYTEAYNFCKDTSIKTGIEIEKIAGIVSALSPQTSWELNKKYTHLFISNKYVAKPANAKDKAGKIKSDLKSIIDILTILNGRKTQAFFINIIKPTENTGYVTIDRHAVAICIQKPAKVSPLADTEYTKHVSTEQKYNCIAEAYKKIAKKYNLLPQDLQAITWLTYRRLRSINFAEYNEQIAPF